MEMVSFLPSGSLLGDFSAASSKAQALDLLDDMEVGVERLVLEASQGFR